MAQKPKPRLAVVFATLQDKHQEDKANAANIPDHSAIYLRVGTKMFRVDATDDGGINITSHTQLVLRPNTTNSIDINEEPF